MVRLILFRRWTSVATLALGLLVGALASWPASAQQLPGTIAAVIDYQKILRDSSAAKSIRDQIETRRKAYQGEISKEEQRLHQAEKELAKQRSLLTPEAVADKRKAFDEDVTAYQRMVAERRRQLDNLSAEALNEVRNALIEIVTGIADERGFNLVLPSSEVLFFARQIDLTDEVLGKLNAKLPEVVVSQKAE